MSQVMIDPNVRIVYNKVVQQLPVRYQKGLDNSIKEKDDIPNGVFIYTANKTYTLNKRDLIPVKGNVEVMFIDSSTHKVIKEEIKDEGLNIPVPGIAVLNGDTLIIAAPPIGPGSIHKIIRGKLLGTYHEYRQGDKVLRLDLSQNRTDNLTIPVKTSLFKLSSLNFKPGQVIYGQVEYITNPYYIDDPDFKSGYICRRMHCKYVFRTKIVDLAKPFPYQK